MSGSIKETAHFTPADGESDAPRDRAEWEKMAKLGRPPAREEWQTFSLPMRLGGYELVEELGRGGMGEVYLARQLSLDRLVAIKTMRPELANDPVFVARFTNEAFAAAQLVHHNFVQIYDITAERDTNFFSMEFVDGVSLAQMLKQRGKLEGTVAAGYILQAARGLALAHEQGLIHRDIKPDNLMLNRHGIIKIADFGIVKSSDGSGAAGVGPAGPSPRVSEADATRGGDDLTVDIGAGAGPRSAARTGITQPGVSIGTPAYMAPEQARDAATVDGRADIYALGCTLYMLVTGRLPFAGRTSRELILKHATAQVVPPEQIVKDVPSALSDVILRMMSKHPDDRFQTMSGVVIALERFLDVDNTGPFSPRDAQARLLEEAVEEFLAAPLARRRTKIILGCLGFYVGLAAFFVRSGDYAGGSVFIGLAVLTPLAHFLLAGVLNHGHLFTKTREVVLGASRSDWLTWLSVAFVGALSLYYFDWIYAAAGVAISATIFAACFYFGVDRPIQQARQVPIHRVERLIKRLRLHGEEEDSLRQFVAKYSGPRWEEFYEAIFGYEAKLVARDRWGKADNGRARPRFAAWRDPIVRYLDAILRARQQARQHQRLVEVGRRGLRARGLSEAEARKKAFEEANATMLKALATLQAIESRRGMGPSSPSASKGNAQLPRYAHYMRRSRALRLLDTFAFIYSHNMRVLLASILILGCALWMRQNDMLSRKNVEHVIDKASAKIGEVQSLDDLKRIADAEHLRWGADRATRIRRPLVLPHLPPDITRWFGNFPAGAAGLVMGLSALTGGRKSLLLALLAALLFASQFLLSDF